MSKMSAMLEEFKEMLDELPDSAFKAKPGDNARPRRQPREPSNAQRNADRARCAKRFAGQAVARIKTKRASKFAPGETLH